MILVLLGAVMSAVDAFLTAYRQNQEEELIGFEASVRCLSRLLSYRYQKALIPIVLANTLASISNQPSGSILAQFVERVLYGED